MTGRHWAAEPERGSLPALKVGARLALRLGWPVGQALLVPITAYFVLTSPRARRASRDFLARALGRRATARDVFRHLHVFASAMLDRLFLLTGRDRDIALRVVGLDHLRRLAADGRGCLLVGAHIGSFEALRAIARDSPVAVRPLMHRGEAGVLSRLLEDLNPAALRDVIEVGRPDTMLRVRESLDRGEFVGILADRIPSGERWIAVPFLGRPAPFPTGPLVLASILRVPVVLFYGVRTAARRYEIGFEPLADRIVVRRSSRGQDLRGWIELYARWMERQVRAHPFNWFNFYLFWDPPPDGRSEP